MRIVNCQRAMEELSCSSTYLSALRKAAGISARRFDLEVLFKYLADHPHFVVAQVYPPARHNSTKLSDGSGL